MTNIEKIRQVLENIEDYLHWGGGVSGLPLLYVAYESSALRLLDPGYGMPTNDAELIKRGPHTGTNFQRHNITV
jgi:hypothetical protein